MINKANKHPERILRFLRVIQGNIGLYVEQSLQMPIISFFKCSQYAGIIIILNNNLVWLTGTII
jgi:hypothetical protein